jgi:hypothetical protein
LLYIDRGYVNAAFGHDVFGRSGAAARSCAGPGPRGAMGLLRKAASAD